MNIKNIKKSSFFKRNLKLLLAIISIIVVVGSLLVYKFLVLKYSIEYFEDNFGFKAKGYNYKFIPSPAIEIKNISLSGKEKYKIHLDHVVISSSLFSDEFQISVDGDVKILNQDQEFIVKLDPKTLILAKFADKNVSNLVVKSPDMEIFDALSPVFEIRDIDLMYSINNIDNEIISDIKFSSNNYSKLTSSDVMESRIDLEYSHSYVNSDANFSAKLPDKIKIDKLELSTPKFSISTAGSYDAGIFDFNTVLLNKEFMLSFLIDSVKENSADIFNDLSLVMPGQFRSEEDFVKYMEDYNLKIEVLLNNLAKNNKSTAVGRDVFRIESDPGKIFIINNIAFQDVLKMFEGVFAQ
ncbi:MAG: hypothetical protein ACI9IL_000528 [Rickettsiales bacterium]|jgi:hypothetical protein